MLILQRSPFDCVLCCLAMALALSYEETLARLNAAPMGGAGPGGLGDQIVAGGCAKGLDLAALEALGADADDFHRLQMSPHWSTVGFLRNLLWGRRAIITVRSKNQANAHHAVYWNGGALFDPSPRRTYDWAEVEPIEFVIFNERGPAARATARFNSDPSS